MCLKAKEFLAQSGITFNIIDVDDPDGRARLSELGLRQAPVVVKGERFMTGKNLHALAQFVGVPPPGHIPLQPEELFRKWINVLRAAQRFVRQLPVDQMAVQAKDIRKRSTRILSHHIFSIGDAYLECAAKGSSELVEHCKRFQLLKNDEFNTGGEVARYGEAVIARLEQWWNALADRSCQRRIKVVYYGEISVHQLLERCVWHSAHHCRQLVDVLERLGIAPNGRLTAQDLAGLPLPERTWN